MVWSERSNASSVTLDACRLDDLGPLVGLVRDKSCKLCGCERHRLNAYINKTRPSLRIGEGGSHRVAELADDFGGRVLGSAKAIPAECLIAWYKFANGRNVRQHPNAIHRGHRKGTQLAVLDQRGHSGYWNNRELHLCGN